MPFLLFSLILLPLHSNASIDPMHLKNGVIRTGEALKLILNEQSDISPLQKCLRDSKKVNLFSNHCDALVAQLKKKMNTMVLESDLQIQSERILPQVRKKQSRDRISILAKINLLATQAEDSLKLLEHHPDYQRDLAETLKAVQKVQTSYQSYLKLILNGKI